MFQQERTGNQKPQGGQRVCNHTNKVHTTQVRFAFTEFAHQKRHLLYTACVCVHVRGQQWDTRTHTCAQVRARSALLVGDSSTVCALACVKAGSDAHLPASRQGVMRSRSRPEHPSSATGWFSELLPSWDTHVSAVSYPRTRNIVLFLYGRAHSRNTHPIKQKT